MSTLAYSRSAVVAVARRWDVAALELGQRPQGKHVVSLERGEAKLVAQREELPELLAAGWRPLDVNRTGIDQHAAGPACLQEARSEGVQARRRALPKLILTFVRLVHRAKRAARRIVRKAGGAA